MWILPEGDTLSPLGFVTELTPVTGSGLGVGVAAGTRTLGSNQCVQTLTLGSLLTSLSSFLCETGVTTAQT